MLVIFDFLLVDQEYFGAEQVETGKREQWEWMKGDPLWQLEDENTAWVTVWIGMEA